MSKLYWRIFLAFWAVIILTTVVTGALNSLFFADEVEFTRAQVIRDSLDALSEQAERALRSGGEDELRSWLRRRVEGSPRPSLLIIAPDGRELLGRRLPPGMRERLRPGEVRPVPRGPRFMGIQVRPLMGLDGRVYRMVVPRLSPRAGRWFAERRMRRMYPLVLVLVSGLVCFALARYLTRPINAFRTAGQKIAAGDLSARVTPVIGERRDDFGALAGDFDHMADRIETLIGNQQRLLRDVSHELRSPLARLQAAVGLIQKNGVTGLDRNLERIEHEAHNLDSLVGQILTMARLESASSIDARPTDLDALLESVVADARFEAASSERELVYQPCGGFELNGDARLLHSAIENVVRNAVQHSRRVTRVTLRPNDQAAHIEVIDDGNGVADEDLPQLFEPFFTKPSGEAGRTSGAGIGLAIARRAIELHGGAISAMNAEQGGLRVVIELPRSAGQRADMT